MKATIADVEIECLRGDITRQRDIAAIVNAANAQLAIGGGVAGAIHKAAGPGLADECAPMAPIEPGQAVLSGAHALPNEYVIHCLGPVYGRDEPSDELLAACYRNALDIAEREGIESVAFPALSTGAFGYPLDAAADVAMNAVVDAARGLQRVKRIRFCLFGEADEQVHADKLAELT